MRVGCVHNIITGIVMLTYVFHFVQASYAASVVGYLTKRYNCMCVLENCIFKIYQIFRPAGVLLVPGPGLIHALPGIANAAVNCW